MARARWGLTGLGVHDRSSQRILRRSTARGARPPGRRRPPAHSGAARCARRPAHRHGSQQSAARCSLDSRAGPCVHARRCARLLVGSPAPIPVVAGRSTAYVSSLLPPSCEGGENYATLMPTCLDTSSAEPAQQAEGTDVTDVKGGEVKNVVPHVEDFPDFTSVTSETSGGEAGACV